MNDFYLVTIDLETDLQKLTHGIPYKLSQSILITMDGESGAALLEITDQTYHVTVNGDSVLDVSHLQNGDSICADGVTYVFASKMAAVIPNEPRLPKVERDRQFDLEAANLIFSPDEEFNPVPQPSATGGLVDRFSRSMTRKNLVRSAIGSLVVLSTGLFFLNWNKDAEALDQKLVEQKVVNTPKLISKNDPAPAPLPAHAEVDPPSEAPMPQDESASNEDNLLSQSAISEVQQAKSQPAKPLKKKMIVPKKAHRKVSISKKLAARIRQKIEEASLIAGYDPDRARHQLTKLRDSLPRGNKLRRLADRELGKL